jgi:hypothetical protein
VSRIATQVQCPVRVLHMPTNPLPEAVSRHGSELFPAGELRVLPPSEPGMSFGESFAVVWAHNTELVSGRAATPSDRLLATIDRADLAERSADMLAACFYRRRLRRRQLRVAS